MGYVEIFNFIMNIFILAIDIISFEFKKFKIKNFGRDICIEKKKFLKRTMDSAMKEFFSMALRL
jgi:hypothetical protein